MGKVGNFLRSFSALHISRLLLPWASWAVCRAVSSGSPTDASQCSVTPVLSGTELAITVTCPQCNAAFCSPKGWLVPKAAKYLQLPLNSQTWEKTHENLTRETNPPEEKQLRFAYILADILQGNIAGFLQVERCVSTNPGQAADPCNHNQPASEPRHHNQVPLLASGGVFSNVTMRERNVMEVPPTLSATPHWYFTLALFLLPTQQIWLFQSPSQKHSKPWSFPQAAKLRDCSV